MTRFPVPFLGYFWDKYSRKCPLCAKELLSEPDEFGECICENPECDWAGYPDERRE